MPHRAVALVALAACSSSPKIIDGHDEAFAKPYATGRCTPGWVALDPDTIGGIALAEDDVVWSATGRGAVMRTWPNGATTAIAAVDPHQVIADDDRTGEAV